MTEWPDPPAPSDPPATPASYGQYAGDPYPHGSGGEPAWPPAAPGWDRPGPASPGGGGRRPRGRRRLLLIIAAFAVVLALALAAAVTLRPPAPATKPAATTSTATGAHRTSNSGHPAPPPPAVSRAEARKILAAYIPENNTANVSLSGLDLTRSEHDLSQIEGDSALRLNDGGYQFTIGELTLKDPVTFGVPITDSGASFYIPRLAQGTWPRWFVTEGTWAALSSADSGRFTPVRQYDVFSQATAHAPWLVVNEPDVNGATPAIATDAAGYATVVSPATQTGLAAAPASLPAATAAQLDRTQDSGPPVTGLLPTQDQKDEAGWQGREPAGVSVTVRHSAATDPVYALRLRDGGALAFYAVHAQLTLTAPAGQQMTVQVPGYFSQSQAEPSASMPYEDEFAVSIPARGPSAHLAVAAQLSSIAASS